MANMYERFRKKKLPADFQKDCEGFASMSHSTEEKFFRAGFYCGLNLKQIFTDPDNPGFGQDFILVRKQDINLEWYQKTKAIITKENDTN